MLRKVLFCIWLFVYITWVLLFGFIRYFEFGSLLRQLSHISYHVVGVLGLLLYFGGLSLYVWEKKFCCKMGIFFGTGLVLQFLYGHLYRYVPRVVKLLIFVLGLIGFVGLIIWCIAHKYRQNKNRGCLFVLLVVIISLSLLFVNGFRVFVGNRSWQLDEGVIFRRGNLVGLYTEDNNSFVPLDTDVCNSIETGDRVIVIFDHNTMWSGSGAMGMPTQEMQWYYDRKWISTLVCFKYGVLSDDEREMFVDKLKNCEDAYFLFDVNKTSLLLT